jgi:hypothetical protein
MDIPLVLLFVVKQERGILSNEIRAGIITSFFEYYPIKNKEFK